MLRPAILILSSMLALACAPEPEPMLTQIGYGCEQSSECESGLCQHLVCVDDQDGPYLTVSSPDNFEGFDAGLTGLYMFFSIPWDGPAGDRVMVTIDPGEAGETTVVFDEFHNGFPTGTTEVPVPGGLSEGPHRMLTQIIDASGEPYPNPDATDLRTIFVRNAEVPNTPQVAIHWPPPGHEFIADQPIVIDIGVLPGSFTFSSWGGACRPLADCTPAFAPECEDTCGPVARSGSALLYIEEDFPACLADAPISCELSFAALLTPGSQEVELLDGHLIRGTIEIPLPPGEYTLTAALSYAGACSIYPSRSAAMYDQIPISVR
jgi:hypothetical protein